MTSPPHSVYQFLKTGAILGIRVGSHRQAVLHAFGPPVDVSIDMYGRTIADASTFYYYGSTVFFEGDLVCSLGSNIEETHEASTIAWEDLPPAACSPEDFLDLLRQHHIQFTLPGEQHEDNFVCLTEGGVTVISRRGISINDEGERHHTSERFLLSWVAAPLDRLWSGPGITLEDAYRGITANYTPISPCPPG